MGIRQNIIISVMIHIMAVASVLMIADRIRGTADHVSVNHLMVTLFREMTASTFATSSTHPLSGLKKKKIYEENRDMQKSISDNITTPSNYKDMKSEKTPESVDARTVSQIQHTSISAEKFVLPSGKENDGNSQSFTPISKVGPGGLSVSIIESQGGQDLYALIRNAIEKAKVYPLLAKKRKIEGTVVAGFTIDDKGNPQHIKIEKSSGHEILDLTALRIVKNASPLPYVQGEITVPISFRLTE